MLLPEVVSYLNSQGIASFGVDLFYGPLKEAYPDEILIVQEYGGSQDEPTLSDNSVIDSSQSFGKGIRLEYPHIQVLCRGNKNEYDPPRLRAERARRSLLKVLNQTISGVFYVAIETLQPPFRLRQYRRHRPWGLFPQPSAADDGRLHPLSDGRVRTGARQGADADVPHDHPGSLHRLLPLRRSLRRLGRPSG